MKGNSPLFTQGEMQERRLLNNNILKHKNEQKFTILLLCVDTGG